MITLNQYKDLVRGFAVAHKDLKGRFFEGASEDFDNDKSQLYPALLMYIEPTTVNEFDVAYKSTLTVLDKVDTDRINRIEVQSDTELVLRDLIAFLYNQDGISDIDLNVAIDHLDGVFNDDVAGSTMDLTTHVFNNLSVCEVPFDAAPVAPNSAVIILDQNGNTLYTLYPGQKLTIEKLQQIIQTLTDPAPVTLIQTLT